MPQTIGALIIGATNYAIAEGAAVVASEAFIVPFATSGTILGVSSATIVGTIALAGVAYAVTPGTPKPSIQKVNIRQAVSLRRRGYGYARIGGTMAFLRRSMETGDGILYMVVCLHTGEIDSIVDHWIGDQVTRIFDADNFLGIIQAEFPALAEGSKPPATDVIITAYDPGYVLPSIVANYTISGTPTTLTAISVGIVDGEIISVVFPYTVEGQKPLASSVTFTIGGIGADARLSARPNGHGLWDGGFSHSNVNIDDPGHDYTDTVGGFGAYLRPQVNGAGNWDGGDVAVDAYGEGYDPSVVVQAHYGSTTLAATHVVVGSPNDVIGGAVNYPPVWFDNGRVTIQYQLGAPSQISNGLLKLAFPGGWTDSHRLDGIAYAMLKLNGVNLDDFSKVYKAGTPTYTATAKLSKVWDPRDESQSQDDTTTWQWSDNAALVILDYLCHPDGMRLPRALFDGAISDWIDSADYCDDQMALLSGACEARYRLWCVYDFNEEPKAILGKMLTAVDGRLRLREDGSIVLDLGKFDCPTACEVISDADILAYDGLRRGLSKSELKNQITANYLSPGHNYFEQEADPWINQDSIDVDGLQTATLDLTYCPSHRQARRRMKVEAHRLNPEWAGTILTNATGLRLLGKRYARFRIDDLGLDETFFIKQSEINLLNGGTCSFDVISFPASAYDWTVVEEGVSPENDTPGSHGIAIPEGATQLRIICDGAGGGGKKQGCGGGGAQCIKTIALEPDDFQSIITFTVGDGGKGTGGVGIDTSGGASRVNGTVTAGVIDMTAGGGKSGSIGGAGGTASGGDTNTNGHDGSTGHGGRSAAGALAMELPGGGGDQQLDGAWGKVSFQFEPYVAPDPRRHIFTLD